MAQGAQVADIEGKNDLFSSKVAQSTSYFPHALRRLRLCSPRTGGRDRRPRKAPQSPSSICCPEYLYETIHEIVNRWNRMMSGSHTKLSTILRESAMNCISNSGTAAPSSVDDRVHQFEVSKDEDGAGHGENMATFNMQ